MKVKKTQKEKKSSEIKPGSLKGAKKVKLKLTVTKERPIIKEVEKKSRKVVQRYFEAVGRRKTAIARVRLYTKGEKAFLINGEPYDVYFKTLELQKTARAALEEMICLDKFRISVFVKGGGLSSQAEAVRHGITRALVCLNADFRKRLKKAGFLKRDSRMRERKKFGLKRARRAPQWQKR